MIYPTQFTFSNTEVTIDLPVLNAGLEDTILSKIHGLLETVPELVEMLDQSAGGEEVNAAQVAKVVMKLFEKAPAALFDITSDISGKDPEYLKQKAHYADLFRLVYQTYLIEQDRFEVALSTVVDDLGIVEEAIPSSDEVAVTESAVA